MRLLVLFCFLTFINGEGFSQGKALFEGRCNSCHQIDKNGTGPMLKGAKKRWADANEKDLIVEWVINNEALRASKKSKRALEIYNEYNKSPMTVFSDLTPKQVNEILDYVDAEAAKGAAGGDKAKDKSGVNPAEEVKEGESGTGYMWYILAVLFIVIILSVGGVRRQLQVASSGNEELNKLTYWEEIKQLLWKYRKTTAVSILVMVLSLVVYGFNMLYSINVMEGYQPSQPIAFPHDKHAGLNGIDCKYCHNSVAKSKSAGLPTVNVCMNCHKSISEYNGPVTSEKDKAFYDAEIQKIYEAIGWDAEKLAYKENYQQKPIKWVRVHNLGDFAYFNHAQHVTVAGLACQKCHGPVETMEDLYQFSPLTMGWCIECHKTTDVNLKGNDYYTKIHEQLADTYGVDKVTVAQLGGKECGKCHY